MILNQISITLLASASRDERFHKRAEIAKFTFNLRKTCLPALIFERGNVSDVIVSIIIGVCEIRWWIITRASRSITTLIKALTHRERIDRNLREYSTLLQPRSKTPSNISLISLRIVFDLIYSGATTSEK